jgi:hypothetical protein
MGPAPAPELGFGAGFIPRCQQFDFSKYNNDFHSPITVGFAFSRGVHWLYMDGFLFWAEASDVRVPERLFSFGGKARGTS